MQNPNHISLNAIRIFATVAQCSSIKLAAEQIGVTPGAVSRQISGLESTMNLQLLRRSNNSIYLTETGATFLHNALPALRVLNRSIEAAMDNERDLVVEIPTTLATRWLIPRLGEFKARWPDINVRISTHAEPEFTPGPQADICIAYQPIGSADPEGEVLLEDYCQPYLSPGLLEQISDPTDLQNIPALQCTAGNWDWPAWLRKANMPNLVLRYEGYFDLDDTALRAAIAGMGMVLSSEFIIQDDLVADRLCPLPRSSQILLGRYILKTGFPLPETAKIFARWLKSIR